MPPKSIWIRNIILTIFLFALGLILQQQTKKYYELSNSRNQTNLYADNQKIEFLNTKDQLQSLQAGYDTLQASYSALASTDQKVKNDTLETEIKNIRFTFSSASSVYEDLLKLRERGGKTGPLDITFAKVLSFLGKQNYASASSTLKTLTGDIEKENTRLSSTFTIPATVAANNSPPNSGYSRQKVSTPHNGDFLVDIISADLKTTKVVVDTASASDCHTDCPVLPLADFSSRSGAYAAINGPYFCPAEYPSCVDKKNSFDTLMMNKNKTYFNSDNNVYSSVPAAIFSTTSRFVEKSQEWGRDTGVDSVIAGQPLLVFNGSPRFNGDDDVKKTAKGTRAFIGATGSTVYIGLVRNASVAEVSQVLATMGIQNAINLDSGGSTAMISGGKYIAGPGRNLPFGILLVKR